MEPIDFQKVIDSYCLSQIQPLRQLAKNEFTASILTGCVRQAVKNKKQLNDKNIDVLRNFQIGTNVHRFLQQDCSLGFFDRPVEFEKQVKFEHDDITIYGHVDCYDGENIYDFKTTSDIAMSKRFDIHIGYVYQLSTYLHALNAKNAYIVYIGKKDFNVITKKVEPYGPSYIARFCHSVMDAIEAYDAEGILPEKDKCFVCQKER